jgi:hypothetical protein
MIIMCEKFGTSGIGTGVTSATGVGTGDTVGIGKGADVGGRGVGADSVRAGWQAEVRREARVITHNRRRRSFMLASFGMDYRAKSKCTENVIFK